MAREMDKQYRRDPDLFVHNPCVQQRMRAVLLDWLNEVCVHWLEEWSLEGWGLVERGGVCWRD